MNPWIVNEFEVHEFTMFHELNVCVPAKYKFVSVQAANLRHIVAV